MKQKIRFRMRWTPRVGDDVESLFAIGPERDICPSLTEWMQETKMSWWPIVGRKAE